MIGARYRRFHRSLRTSLPGASRPVAFVALLAIVVGVLSGCWTIRPEEHIEFSRALELDRAELADGATIVTEAGRDRLIASSVLPGGAVALYYVDVADADHPDLTAADVSRIVLVPPSEAASESLRTIGTCDDALLFFPLLSAYREKSIGYDDDDDADPRALSGVGSGYLDGDRPLQWRFAVTVPPPPPGIASFDADRASPGNGPGPVTVEFRLAGTEEDDTRSIFVFIRARGEEVTRFTLPRSTFGMKERLDPEVQRVLRGIRRDHRYLLVADRMIDLRTGETRRLYEGAPASYVDHFVWDPVQGIAGIVYGTWLVTKQLRIAALSPDRR